MPQETKKKDVAPADDSTSLQGMVATRADELALLDALEKAFDYRGDVTITLTSGEVLTGYIFDRRRGDSLASSTLRLMPQDSDERRPVQFNEIDRVEFTGKDAAHGKSFERWVERYVEKKMKGEDASIYSEPLDE